MIIGILGTIGSGKNTVADYLVETNDFAKDSFASSLKDACANIFDWPRNMLEGDTLISRQWRDHVDDWWTDKLGIKDFTPRLALQLIGTDGLRNHFHPDIWFLTLQNRIRKNLNQHTVISDVRFPNEVQYIQDIGGILATVKRGKPPVWEGIAEKAILKNDQDAWREMKENFPEVHYSEWAWVGTKSNYILENDGTTNDLFAQVREMLYDNR